MAEFAAVPILYFIIDRKELGGRLRIMTLSFICMGVSIILTYIYPDTLLVIGVSFYRFFASLFLPSLIVFTNENYSTVERSMGLGTV